MQGGGVVEADERESVVEVCWVVFCYSIFRSLLVFF